MLRLSLAFAVLWASASFAAAPPEQSVGVTLSPLGAFLVTQAGGAAHGYGASIDWDYRRPLSRWSFGGHVAANRLLTEATPVRVRFSPLTRTLIRPFVGAGPSLMLPHEVSAASREDGSPLKLGAEVSGGIGVHLQQPLFLVAEARYQNFALGRDPFSESRQELFSAFLGVGFKL